MTRLIELGKAGSAGMAKGVLPVLQDGAVVATLRAANWREAATAVVDDQEWIFTKRRRELVGRRTTDPGGVDRFSARQTSVWRGTWSLTLDGAPVEMRTLSHWKATHRYSVGERPVAESEPRGGWSATPKIGLRSSLPLEQQVFLLWFELVVNRRNQATTTAVVAGGAVAGGSS